MADHNYFSNLIWQIADLLRGPYRPPQYERVMLPMTVLRRFDCVLAPTKAKVLAEHARFRDKLKGEALDAKLNKAAGDQRFHNHSPLDYEKLKGDPDHIAQHLVSYINGPMLAQRCMATHVEAARMCRTDFQMVDGYFKDALNLAFPAIPGHEIARSVAEVGSSVPATANLAVGGQVVVVGIWGDGTCRQCRVGNEQFRRHGNWPGFGPFGGYSEFVPVPHKYLIRVDRKYQLKPEEPDPSPVPA